MAAEGAKARDPSGRRRCLRGWTVNCWDVQHRVAEALTSGVGVAGCQAKFWRSDPRNDGRLQGGWEGERSFFLIARHESPSGLPPVRGSWCSRARRMPSCLRGEYVDGRDALDLPEER